MQIHIIMVTGTYPLWAQTLDGALLFVDFHAALSYSLDYKFFEGRESHLYFLCTWKHSSQ